MAVPASAIEALVDDLRKLPSGVDFTNPYSPDTAHNQARAANLQRYLLEMAQRRPLPLLLMEAPGYRGCRLTGIPVTSRKVIRDGVPELSIFGEGSNYTLPDDPGFEDIKGEQSATIVWNTLATIGVLPLIWNSYPLHPHKPEQPRSNRKPRKKELALGSGFLERILELYQPTQCLAVGRVAESMFSELGVEHIGIRHPAQGGKNDFVAGIEAALKS